MAPLVIYKCSLCRLVRDSYDGAEKCEQTHLNAESVKALEYRLGAYPFRVLLTFPDGKEHEYIKQD